MSRPTHGGPGDDLAGCLAGLVLVGFGLLLLVLTLRALL